MAINPEGGRRAAELTFPVRAADRRPDLFGGGVGRSGPQAVGGAHLGVDGCHSDVQNLPQMFEAAVSEFPFVEAMPKREKSRVARLWERFEEIKAMTDRYGVMLPQHLAADLLGVSRQRVHTLVNEGRLQSVDVGGVRFVTEASMMEFARSERATGRHLEVPGAVETFRKALDCARELGHKKS